MENKSCEKCGYLIRNHKVGSDFCPAIKVVPSQSEVWRNEARDMLQAYETLIAGNHPDYANADDVRSAILDFIELEKHKSFREGKAIVGLNCKKCHIEPCICDCHFLRREKCCAACLDGYPQSVKLSQGCGCRCHVKSFV